ncbi:hypothetical protein [Chengkuizengella marina]|uniref:Uncharacterized protein n=1 Tax=Chengkuizengella marina TaxID=2507566 RepID=A0A6N9Q321_9BACL|nr:hypothetical protein [Chengkuizengella marina]NBI29171.1 hypothetical protein [Chengkuizengella marina]
MRSWRYKTTSDYFDYLDFHDCLVEQVKVEKDLVIIDLETINISEKHPINPHDVAKSTDRCKLTFINVTKSEAILFEENMKVNILITDLEEVEILQFNKKQVKDYFIFDILGINGGTHEFCSLKLHAKSFILQWNDFKENAWYVG